MKPVKTLVLLASEAEARILQNAGPGKGLEELAVLRAKDFPDTDRGFSDGAGRQSAAPGIARHGFAPRETAREARRTTFAAITIEALAQLWHRGGHDRIVIAAAPKLLGELRARMPAELAGAITADLPKDLVKVDLRSLTSHFSRIAAF